MGTDSDFGRARLGRAQRGRCMGIGSQDVPGQPSIQEYLEFFRESCMPAATLVLQVAQAVANQLVLETVILQAGKARRFHQCFLTCEMRDRIVCQLRQHRPYEAARAGFAHAGVQSIGDFEYAPMVGVDLLVADQKDVGPGDDGADRGRWKIVHGSGRMSFLVIRASGHASSIS